MKWHIERRYPISMESLRSVTAVLVHVAFRIAATHPMPPRAELHHASPSCCLAARCILIVDRWPEPHRDAKIVVYRLLSCHFSALHIFDTFFSFLPTTIDVPWLLTSRYWALRRLVQRCFTTLHLPTQSSIPTF